MFDIFGEETKVDLITDNNLTKSDAFDDNYHVQLNPDITDDDLTPLQNIDAFDDKYKAEYDHDLTTDNLLNKEVAYSDNQRTPVDITGYSAESSGLFNENYYAEEEGNSNLKDGEGELSDSDNEIGGSMFFEGNEEVGAGEEKKFVSNPIAADECKEFGDSNTIDMFFEDDELTDIDNDSIDAGGDDMSTIEQPERADADQTTMGEPTVTQMIFETSDDECDGCECDDEDDDDKKKDKDDDDKKKDKDDDDDEVDNADDDEPDKASEKLDDKDDEDKDDKDDDEDDDDKEDKKKSSYFFD